MKQPDLRGFVEAYFDQMKAAGREVVPGVQSYEIPADRRAALNASSIRVTYDPALVERYDGVELLTPGSLLLDRIIEDASGRGHHCVAKVEAGEAPPPEEVLAASLRFRRAKAVVASSSRGQIPYFLFTFRVTLVADEKVEAIEHVFLNSSSLREHRLQDMLFEESLALPEEPLAAPVDLSGAYAAACGVLEEKVAGIVASTRDNATKRLDEDIERIKRYFAGLVEEAKQSKYPAQAAAAIEAYEAEEEKRSQEAKLKYALDASVRLVGVRTILVPNTSLQVKLTGTGLTREIGLEYDEVGFDIPPPRCEGCGKDVDEIGLCGGGHVICTRCELSCAFCDRVSCSACTGADKVSQKCAQCGRLLCGAHACKDDFGLGVYCPDDVMECPSCGRNASQSFVARCGKCSQRYCFLCVTKKERTCATCRGFQTAEQGDADVESVRSQSAFAGKFGKWRKAGNRRFTIVEGRSMLARRTFVLDDKRKLIWEG